MEMNGERQTIEAKFILTRLKQPRDSCILQKENQSLLRWHEGCL